MIKTRNQGELIAQITINGTQSAAAGNSGTTESFVVPFACRLKAIIARLGVAGVTGSQTTDLLKNGATMLASGTLLSYATGSQVPTYASNFLTNPPTFAKGDVLQLKNTAVQTTAAIDQTVLLVLERARAGSWNDVVQTDTLGADSDAIC
jgi:hypothetical protein